MINIFSFGSRRPTEKLVITQFHPNETEEQKNFIHEVPVNPQNLEYRVTLPILNSGLTTYSIRAVSTHGQSRAKLVQVWNNADTSQKPIKMVSKDKAVYMLG